MKDKFLLLKELCNCFGVSGVEDKVRNIICENASKYCDNLTVDKIGNVVCYKKGKVDNKKIMLTAHMDEVGFIAHHITEEGYVGIRSVGGIDARILISQPVVFENGIIGVIGAKPPHLNEKGEEKSIKISDLLVDIGANSKSDAEKLVSLGDYLTFNSEYVEFGHNSIKAKAIDDRVGCYILLNLLKNVEPKYDTYYVFTVQEEVGCRGANVASRNIHPDIAIVVEGTTCSDLPKINPYSHSTKFGGGGAISIMDNGSYSNNILNEELFNIAAKNNICIQKKLTTLGGNDGRSIQIKNDGVATAVISAPCRYIHSPINVVNKKDIESIYNLLYMYI